MEDNSDPVVFGVVAGTPDSPRVSYLEVPQPLTAEIKALCAPATPAEVLRISTPCVAERCKHFDGGNCTLAERVVRYLRPVVDILPACKLRPGCRWWVQHGAAACLRCPQVVRTPSRVTDEHRKVAEREEAF
jgi:hypothetical protein